VDTGSREENASNRVASTTRSLLKPGRNTLPTIDLLARFRDRLSLPLIAAPMFLVSGTDLVVAACRNGVIGSFPTVNCRSPEQLDEWLTDIDIRLKANADASGKPSAPVCANLIVHRSNARLDAGSAGAAAAPARNGDHLGRIAGAGDRAAA
jgi:nitronate monooxygenase